MNKFIVVTALLCLTGWNVMPAVAEPGKVPISRYNNQQQLLVEDGTLDAYHDEIARFYGEISDLRHQIWEKSHLFARLLTIPDTSKARIMALQQEIQLMTIQLQREELSFRWDLNDHFPELQTDRYRGCLSAATGTIGPGR